TSLLQRRAEILALLDGEDTMRPVFQPLVDLETADVAGYDALTRLPGPDHGPEHWFEQARRCGLGGPLEARAIALALAAPDRPEGALLTRHTQPSRHGALAV